MKPKAPIPTIIKGLTKGLTSLTPSKVKVYKSEDGSSMVTIDAQLMNDPTVSQIFLELYTQVSPFHWQVVKAYPYLSVSYTDNKGKFKKETVTYREGECTQLTRLVETAYQDILPPLWYEPLPNIQPVHLPVIKTKY